MATSRHIDYSKILNKFNFENLRRLSRYMFEILTAGRPWTPACIDVPKVANFKMAAGGHIVFPEITFLRISRLSFEISGSKFY